MSLLKDKDHILNYICTFEDDHNIYIVSTLFDESIDLKRYMNLNPLPEFTTLVDIMHQITLGCKCISEHNICHLDLKPSNIVISFTPALHVIIVDFGLSRKINTRGVRQGTHNYISPDMINRLDIDARTDIYSLGFVFFNILSGGHTRGTLIDYLVGKRTTTEEMHTFIGNKTSHDTILPLIPTYINEIYLHLIDLIIRMISYDKMYRPYYNEILTTVLKHKFADKIS